MAKEYEGYLPTSLPGWIATAQRHHIRDVLFFERLAKYFKPGNILEIGAGCGQPSEILQKKGYDVISSDLEPFFVDYMKSRGLNAYVIDAREIQKYIDEQFDNIIAQGLTPLMRRDLAATKQTYQTIWNALKKNGRLFCICSSYRFSKKKPLYLTLKEQLAYINELDCFKIIDIIKHQIFKPSFYNNFNEHLLNYLDFALGKYFGIRYIIILEKKL